MPTTHDVLKRWNSCPDQLNIPKTPADNIKRIHIYDFDNTLYKSPQPNKSLFSRELLTFLLSENSNLPHGNWWSDNRSLKLSYLDSQKKDNGEKRKQDSYWESGIVDLANESYADAETISIVLTGRKEAGFGSLINEMISNCIPTTKFNAVCLKKHYVQHSSTAEYKIRCISDLIQTYSSSLLEVKVYDDRPGQLKHFESFFSKINRDSQFKLNIRFRWFVIPVTTEFKYLEPSEEIKLVKRIIEEHNTINPVPRSIYETPIQTGFFLSVSSQKELISWTLKYFKRNPKGWVNNILDYPAYIPCGPKGVKLDIKEVAKIWCNNNPKIMKKEGSIESCYNEFLNQQNLNKSERCLITFRITEVGYKISKTASSLSRHIPVYDVFYKVVRTDAQIYIFSSYPFLTIVGSSNYKKTLITEETIIDSIFNNKEGPITWIKVKPITITSYFRQYSKLQIN